MVRASISNLLGKIAVLSIIFCCCLPAQAKYGGGSGTSNDPYLIYDANQMNAIGADANDWDKHFKLMADIDLSGFTGTSFNIIGYYANSSDNKPFFGVFDGNGHSIYSFSYECDGVNFVGLFCYVDNEDAEITNLTLIEPYIDAGTGSNVGMLVGCLNRGVINNCHVQGGSVSGGGAVGGLTGKISYKGTIESCSSTASVFGTSDYVGGLLGIAVHYGNTGRAIISNSYSGGSVSANSYVGGIIGENQPRYGILTISNCYCNGKVIGNYYVGGLVGRNWNYYGNLKISNCYSTAFVSGNNCFGGLIGQNLDTYGDVQILTSYWDLQTSGQTISDGGRGKTTAQMKDLDTFIGWGCDSVWTIDEGNDYPRLFWENKPGQPIIKPSYGGGSGEPNDPYLIYTARQFNWVGSVYCDWDKHFKLMADIDLNCFPETELNMIGNDYYNPFTGVFDGNGHTISNFRYNSPEATSYIGLFRYVRDPNAQIRNLVLINPRIDAGTEPGTYYSIGRVGSLVGCFSQGSIINCLSVGGNVFGTDCVGGLVGVNSSGRIKNCYSSTTVSGDVYIGGLVGSNNSSSNKMAQITNSYSEGVVSGNHSVGGLVGENDTTSPGRSIILNSHSKSAVTGQGQVGGLVGINSNFWGGEAEIHYSYSTGIVSGESTIGGLVGKNYWGDISNSYSLGDVLGTKTVGGLVGDNRGKISNCYSTGSVSGIIDVGGLVGDNYKGTVTDSFWDIETSEQTTSAGGTGKTTQQMQDPTIFLEVGWDFVNEFENGPSDLWALPEGGGYPIFWWQLSLLPALPSFSGGCGEPNNPYLIANIDDLNKIGHNPRLMQACFKLINDIDLKDINLFILANRVFPFTGIFDGNGHTIANFTYDSTGIDFIGLFRYVEDDNAEIKNLGLFDPNIDARTGGTLVGWLYNGTIINCYVEGGSVSGFYDTGGMVGRNDLGIITNCYSSISVKGNYYIGGLVGTNDGTITECDSRGDVSGLDVIGGLVGKSSGIIINCYSECSVSGDDDIGGLLGGNSRGTITNCFSTSSVMGNRDIGGLVGYNYKGTITTSFWDIETSGQTTSAGGIGLETFEMQTMSTFTDAGWDFNTPVWTIDDGNDYPRLWWEFVPTLYAEPEITLGNSNTISWEPVAGDVEYYAECAKDAKFTNILYNTGWITEASYVFTGLELGKRYWYSVKARNAVGIETNWSNVESSLQCSLSDAVDIILDPNSLKNANMKNALMNKIDEVLAMIDEDLFKDALNKLEHDILQKTNGCAETDEPDKNDWIITCEEQIEIYPLIIETIEYVRSLIE